jgi:hypothetical protein
MKTFEIYKNGTQQGEVKANSLEEAKNKVFAYYGENREVIEVENSDSQDSLPTVADYRILLHKAVETFNISFENARMKYGKFTYQDWENLLTKKS